VNIFGFKSLEPNEALFNKRREELIAWKSTHEEFDESELGRSGVDLLPNPLSMPVAVRASFDTRQVVAARQGVEVLCELLSGGSEAQRRSAVFALRNLADPAVTAGLHGAQANLPLEKPGSLLLHRRRVVHMLMAARAPKLWPRPMFRPRVAEAPPGRERRVEACGIVGVALLSTENDHQSL
ncbi:RYR1, partial [Symbiodinium microadriaticum]